MKYYLILIAVVLNAASFLTAFPTGKERSYTLLNTVRLGDHKHGPTIAYQLSGNVRVGSVWGSDELKLLQFHLTNPRLHLPPKSAPSSAEFVDQKSLLETAVNRPFYAIWHLGAITKVYAHSKEDPSLINVKKAVISLFQYQLLDGEYDELDVSGKCQVGYASKSKSVYEKTWRRCESDDLVFHRRADRAIGVNVESARTSSFKVTNDGTLLEVDATERHHVVVVANTNAGSYLESSFSLKFDGSISNIAPITTASIEEAIKTVKGLKKQTILTEVLVPSRRRENSSFKDAVKLAKDDLTDEMIGTHSAALALVKGVMSAKTTSKSEFLKVLNAHTLKELKGQLIDIIAATQTKDSHEAALETLRFQKEADADLVERYLQGLAVGTRPLEWVLNDLLRLSQTSFEQSKVRDTLVQTIAAMAFRFARLPQQSYTSKIVVQSQELIVKSLAKCEDIPCRELYLRALHNLQSVSTVPLLLEHVAKPERTVSVAAMKALRTFPTDTWTAAHKKMFERIFYQLSNRFDTSVRTLALDILLELKPNQMELEHMVGFLRSNEKQFEVKKYLLQKLQMLATDCPHFRKAFDGILAKESKLNNYHVLGQRGMTTAMSRSYSNVPSFNATLLSIQEIYGGVLKRGLVDMTVSADRDHFSVFTLGLYAGGLSSFVSSSSETDPDEPASEEPATAGMEVSVQGAYFRPLQFFGSQSELMGHAWSGTASEPTDAYTATTLLHDHNEVIRLQNGAGLGVEVLSAVSIDLNGQVQFSLWNRNAHCQVDKNSGIALLGSLAVETSFVNLRSQFTVTQEPRLSVESDIDFSGDIKLCIQLSQPESVLTHSIVKSTKVHGTNVVRRITRTKNFLLPGFTHALNQKNNEMCNVILDS